MLPKNFLIRLCSGILFVAILAQCGPITAIPVSVMPTAQPSPQVQAQPVQDGPRLVEQDPPVGQRLGLSSAIQFTFDRDMDQTKTADAFTLRDSDNQPVRGKINWI